VTVRQTDEGGVMIGDSEEARTTSLATDHAISSLMAERAIRMFPLLADLNVVRTWSAFRVISPDGFPIYDQSRTHPGAFVAMAHSGVTLAPNHTFTLADHIAAGALPDRLQTFSAERFDVPTAG
jgi:hydrogen cyanide synthase HcnC